MSSEVPDWTLFSPHAHVLICLAKNPRSRLREVAARVGVTERTAMRLIDRLDRAGVIRRVRQGRRNYYEIDAGSALQHPLETGCSVERVLGVVLQSDPDPEEKSVDGRDRKKSIRGRSGEAESKKEGG